MKNNQPNLFRHLLVLTRTQHLVPPGRIIHAHPTPSTRAQSSHASHVHNTYPTHLYRRVDASVESNVKTPATFVYSTVDIATLTLSPVGNILYRVRYSPNESLARGTGAVTVRSCLKNNIQVFKVYFEYIN